MIDNMKAFKKNAREKIYVPLLISKGHSNFLKNINFLKNDIVKLVNTLLIAER